MNAMIGSDAVKTSTAAHALVAKRKVQTPKANVSVPVKSAEVINKVPAKKVNSTPAAIVSLGKTKAPEPALYKPQVNKKAVTSDLTPPPLKPATAKVESGSASGSSSGGFVAGKGDVVIDIKNSDSGYDNKIFWSTDNFKTKNYIGVDNNTGSVNIGKFAEGTNIEFGIDNGAGQFFRTGSAAQNIDNVQHAKSTQTAEGMQFGFEDLYGGGDNDFNDAIINVKNVAVAEVDTSIIKAGVNVETKVPSLVEPKNLKPVKKAPPKLDIIDPKIITKVKTKQVQNRSGLGDNTNPGQGGGTINATNTGTNSPSKINAYFTKPVVGGQLKVAV